MQMRRLGNSGLFVSEMCFGAMTFGGSEGIWGQVGRLGQDDADSLVGAALDLGITFFDTANVYASGRSEEMLGQSLKTLGVVRDDVVIATKAASAMGPGPNQRGASRRHVITECHASLRRLGLDHIDLYQIHAFDPSTPMEETLSALNDLVRAGHVRYLGLSNWAAWQVMKAIGIVRARDLAPITSLQAYYTLAGRDLEREIGPMLASEGVGLMVWSPLAGGMLSGKFHGHGDATGARRSELNFPPMDLPRTAAVVGVLKEVAQRHGCTPAQVALAWLLLQPVVSTVIVGAKRVEQLRENAAATEIHLDAEDLASLDQVSQLPAEYPGWLLSPPAS